MKNLVLNFQSLALKTEKFYLQDEFKIVVILLKFES